MLAPTLLWQRLRSRAHLKSLISAAKFSQLAKFPGWFRFFIAKIFFLNFLLEDIARCRILCVVKKGGLMPDSVIIFLQSLDQWDWFILALVFMVLEVFITGAFFLFLSFTAALVGVIVTIFPVMSWKLQITLFFSGSIINFITWYFYCTKHPDKNSPVEVD